MEGSPPTKPEDGRLLRELLTESPPRLIVAGSPNQAIPVKGRSDSAPLSREGVLSDGNPSLSGSTSHLGHAKRDISQLSDSPLLTARRLFEPLNELPAHSSSGEMGEGEPVFKVG